MSRVPGAAGSIGSKKAKMWWLKGPNLMGILVAFNLRHSPAVDRIVIEQNPAD
jgi:hypothetical protein